ncbi:hypothetical protein [Desulfovibrio psychrotolerans]|uniref:Uncharacterized protein n=1 Tax=Desulfovibrio psychrotolerans TaxID=415242 RepID=A0A7J0BZE6_9BACT|nr:hypothetical protein [Desulfovibrio psychrotolerans]GFM38511.1 hypothetical protein DSM19430T_31950 [Desulfovibrio psychrotolerans]
MALIAEVNADVFIVDKQMEDGGHEMDVYGKALFADDTDNDIILFFPQCDRAQYERIRVGEAYAVRGMASIFAEEDNMVSVQYLDPEMTRIDPESFNTDDRREIMEELDRLRSLYPPVDRGEMPAQ